VESVDTSAGTALTPNGVTSAPQAPDVQAAEIHEIHEMTVADDQDSKQKRSKQLTRNSSKLKRRQVATAETSPKKQKERYF